MNSKLTWGLILLTFLSCSNTENRKKLNNQKTQLIDSYLNSSKDKSKPKVERLKDISNALQVVNSLKNKETIKSTLTSICLEYYYLGEFEQFKSINLKAMQLASELEDSTSIAKSYSNMGSYFNRKKIPDSAYYNFNKASKIYETLDRNKKLNIKSKNHYGSALYNLALIQKRFKDYTGSEANIVSAIKQFEIAKTNKNLFLCYINLGIIANGLGKNDVALDNYQKALGYAKKVDESKYREIQILNNIGVVYKNQKKYDSAINVYQKALGYKNILNKKPRSKAILIHNIAYAKFLSGNRNEVLESFFKALKIRNGINDNPGLITSNRHLAEYYKSINKDDLSKRYAKEAIRLAKLTKSIKEQLTILLFLKDFDENTENLRYANAYIKLNDSLIKEERLYRDKFARIRFETDQKEQQIIEVQNRNTIYLLGMLLLLTIISFTFFFFRQRTKYLAQQNKIVQFQASYDTETRISKRLHDELGNDIFQVMLQYQHNPQDPTIPEKLNTTYNKARDISRENSEFETGATYPQELANMLQNYTQNEVQLILRGLDKIEWYTLDETIKITVYRVLQELMTNMQKHSQATLVALIFANTDTQLTIKYSDNGIGMDESDQKSKNGLRNTEKRIQAINGTLIFTTKKDKGFKAEIQIPS